MGVRGLQTFAQKVADGYRKVNLQQEALNCQKKGTKPILIVDLLPFYCYICTSKHEILLGGRFNIFNERMKATLNSLKLMGYELIFVVDGAMQPNKKMFALKRREEEYLLGIKILCEIDAGLDLTTDFSKRNIPAIKAYFENLIQIAEHYGEVHLALLKECDQEVVHLANTKKALAIISSDTDYIIFDGPWRLWNDLDFHSNTAKEYDKIKIRNCLNLSRPEMKLFASLLGNDFVSDELLKKFNQIYKWQFHKIAQKVRTISPQKNENLQALAKDIFESAHYEKGLNALQRSIDFYSMEGMENIDCENFQKQVAQISRFVYAILYTDEIIMACTYCDFIDFFELYKPLICRLIGVLFSHSEREKTRKIFYFRINGRFTTVPLYATFPSAPEKLPQLENLLLTPYGEDKILDALRWELLCFIVAPGILQPDVVRSISVCNQATYLTLFYLVKANVIHVDEADCILVSCKSKEFPKLKDKISFDNVKTIKSRDVRVAFLFERLMYEMPACFSAVGLKQFAGLITFDGLYFHNLRKIWDSLDSELLASIKKELQPYRMYV